MTDSHTEALIQRILRFPVALRFEQLRAWLVVSLVFAFFMLIYAAALDLEVSLSSMLTLNLPQPLRLFIRLSMFIAFIWVFWRVLKRVFSRTLRVLGMMLGARRNPFTISGVEGAVAILRSGTRFGLFLRAFGDEQVFVPTSRETLPKDAKQTRSSLHRG